MAAPPRIGPPRDLRTPLTGGRLRKPKKPKLRPKGSKPRRDVDRIRADAESRRHERAVDRRKAYLNDPARLTAPLTPQALGREEDAAARLKFDPLRQQLGQQITNTPAYYRNYLAEVAQRQSQNQAYMAGLAQGVNQQAQQAGMAPPGATPEAQQAAQSRQSLVQGFGGSLANQAAAQSAYATNLQDIAGLQQAQTLQGLGEKQRDLSREEADYRTQYRSQAREAERKAALEQAVFGLDTQKAQQQAAEGRSQARQRQASEKRQRAEDRQQQMERDRRYQLDLDKFGESKAKDEYQRRNQLGPYKPAKGEKPKVNKPTARDYKGREAITNARTQYKKFKGDYQKYVRSGNRHSVPLPIIHAGYELEKQGYIGPNTARELKAIGIGVPGVWRRKPPKAKLNRPGARTS